MVVLVMGLPGSGKSYFARKLAEALQAEYISSDQLRRKLFPVRHYTEREKMTVYEEMQQRVKEAVARGNSLVVDATFYLHRLREQFLAAAGGHAVMIEVTAPEHMVKERLQQPRTDSEADYDVYLAIRSVWEPVQQPHLTLESRNDNLDDMLKRTMNYLHLQHDTTGA